MFMTPLIKLIGTIIFALFLIIISIIAIYAQGEEKKRRLKEGRKTDLERNLEDLERERPGSAIWVKVVGWILFILLIFAIFSTIEF
jgi:hypothetical protein